MALRSSSSNSGTSTSPSVPVPTGVAANDIVILLLTDDGSNPHAGHGPSGFTMFSELELTGPDGEHFSAWWKRASGADTGSYSWVGAIGVSAGWVALALAFSGRDTTNPAVSATLASSTTGAGSPRSFSTNSVTALSGDDLCVLVAPDTTIGAPGSLGTTAPTGFTTQQNVSSGNFAWGLAYTQDNAAAGSTSASGNFSWTGGGTAGYGAWLIRIPSAGGGGTDAVVPATVNATSSMSASVQRLATVTPATVTATSTVTTGIVALRTVAGASVTAASTITGTVSKGAGSVTPATINATSTVTAAASRARGVTGTAVATSTVAATLTRTRNLPASIVATSTISGPTLTRLAAIHPATVTATSTVGGSVSGGVSTPVSPGYDQTPVFIHTHSL